MDEARFVHNDVCDGTWDLPIQAIALSRLDEDEKGVTFAETHGGPQEVNVITEFGLYLLIFRSKQAKAEELYPRWRSRGSTHHPQNWPVRSRTTRATAGNRQLSTIDKADVVRARPL